MRRSKRSHIRTLGSFFSKSNEKEREKEKVQRKSHQKVGVGSLEIEEKVAERAVVVATVALHKNIIIISNYVGFIVTVGIFVNILFKPVVLSHSERSSSLGWSIPCWKWEVKIDSLLLENIREKLKKSICVLHFFWGTVLEQNNKGLGLMLSQQRLPQNCATMKSLADSCLLCSIPSAANKMNEIIGSTKLKL